MQNHIENEFFQIKKNYQHWKIRKLCMKIQPCRNVIYINIDRLKKQKIITTYTSGSQPKWNNNSPK